MARPKKEAGLTKSQKEAIETFHKASPDMQGLAIKLRATTLLKKNLEQCERWDYVKGGKSRDTHINIWIKKSLRQKFSANLHNRLLLLLYKYYGDTVLARFILVGADGRLTYEKEDKEELNQL